MTAGRDPRTDVELRETTTAGRPPGDGHGTTTERTERPRLRRSRSRGPARLRRPTGWSSPRWSGRRPPQPGRPRPNPAPRQPGHRHPDEPPPGRGTDGQIAAADRGQHHADHGGDRQDDHVTAPIPTDGLTPASKRRGDVRADGDADPAHIQTEGAVGHDRVDKVGGADGAQSLDDQPPAPRRGR